MQKNEGRKTQAEQDIVINYLPETHSFVLENNCLYNNSAGNYRNARSISDIHVDFNFVDEKNHNYHLKPTGGRWKKKLG